MAKAQVEAAKKKVASRNQQRKKVTNERTAVGFR